MYYFCVVLRRPNSRSLPPMMMTGTTLVWLPSPATSTCAPLWV
ncbi:hypothetical protein E2C01_088093 [Portunus trituberculatus]|uniref:Uncharacterized protein n=1 Tax=Portunus trituberculatus TaxID=210409 RepID=A0A5B7JIY4_PORTR|nr:hypothetical protein [Portunus trituberculatus]